MAALTNQMKRYPLSWAVVTEQVLPSPSETNEEGKGVESSYECYFLYLT